MSQHHPEGATAELLHYGVKGMRWGQTNNLSREVIGARKSLRSDLKSLKTDVKAVKKATNDETANAHISNIRATANRVRESGDVELATMVTRGDKAIGYATYGPFGPAIMRSMNRQYELTTNALLAEYGEMPYRRLAS